MDLFLIMSSERSRRIKETTENFEKTEPVTHNMRLAKTDCTGYQISSFTWPGPILLSIPFRYLAAEWRPEQALPFLVLG